MGIVNRRSRQQRQHPLLHQGRPRCQHQGRHLCRQQRQRVLPRWGTNSTGTRFPPPARMVRTCVSTSSSSGQTAPWSQRHPRNVTPSQPLLAHVPAASTATGAQTRLSTAKTWALVAAVGAPPLGRAMDGSSTSFRSQSRSPRSSCGFGDPTTVPAERRTWRRQTTAALGFA